METIMSDHIANTPLLRFALLGDAAASGGTGLLMAAASAPLAPLLGLPQPLLFWAGALLLPYAAFVGWLGFRPSFHTALVWTVIAVNAIWVIDSIILLFSGWVQPTGLGIAFVIGQAIVVAAFAELQFIGLRKAAHTVPATA
jgi:hypothetical protein